MSQPSTQAEAFFSGQVCLFGTYCRHKWKTTGLQKGEEMALIERLDPARTEIGDPSAACFESDTAATVGFGAGSGSVRVANRQSSRQHKIERFIAFAMLICAGLVAFTVKSVAAAALLSLAGIGLYVHSRVVALWSDED
ncbi:MAG: hypothetical protein ACOYNZ_02185 [Rhodoferax sp.]